jgi:hypothetical protein
MIILAVALGIISCPNAPVGGALSTCTPGQQCVASVTNDTMVRTVVGTMHSWQKWVTIPPSGLLRACDTASTADKGWTTRATSGVTTGTPPPPPPPPPPPAPPTPPVPSSVDALWWTPTTRDTANNLIEVNSYRLYQGTAPGVYGAPITVIGTRYDLSTLAPGTYYFAVTAVYNGVESAKTVEIEFVKLPPPVVTPPAPKVLKCGAASVTDNKTITLTCAYE